MKKLSVSLVIIISTLILTAGVVIAYFSTCPECGSPDVIHTKYIEVYYDCPTEGCDVVCLYRLDGSFCEDPECGYFEMDDYQIVDSWHTDPNCPYSPQK